MVVVVASRGGSFLILSLSIVHLPSVLLALACLSESYPDQHTLSLSSINTSYS